ncbi:2-dehydro-3-deoxygalactonokinase [Ramlibacter albus]|uniref:2-dehydro-3-deoxygalactonokinase n=1 Tax=Ramlibacter albus TaxID=2079448 RepID=A0A923MAH6_9BURK|nr:2-dehydro-3-deoxygalactonokinase [Ramlibacter albus]MBC5765911.1 2-dehydro-3-deoxygalactonokinase [Ramlibacter albus]
MTQRKVEAAGNGWVGVDWGTSSLRAALLDGAGRVLEQRQSARGILSVAAGEFPAVLRELCGDWLAAGRLCLISGMAGSRQGWLEAPYCECPASRDDLARQLAWVDPGRIAIVPGLVCHHGGVPDVMRGEEVQVFGAMELLGVHDLVAVLPGTHSKWVEVHHGRIVSFATAMTGEFYALLRRHSILARTMDEDDGSLDEAAFVQGVKHAQRTGNLLQSAFSARTLALFERMPRAAMPSYLSGLVIGEELRSHYVADARGFVVIGAPELAQRYTLALDASVRCLGAEATWRGLASIAQSIGKP